jgi:hypothetical protein
MDGYNHQRSPDRNLLSSKGSRKNKKGVLDKYKKANRRTSERNLLSKKGSRQKKIKALGKEKKLKRKASAKLIPGSSTTLSISDMSVEDVVCPKGVESQSNASVAEESPEQKPTECKHQIA